MNTILAFVLVLSTLKVSFINGCMKTLTVEKWYAPPFPIQAIAIIKGSAIDPSTNLTNQVSGSITFVENEPNGNVIIRLNITGLPAGVRQNHGIHVHNIGITSTSNMVSDICGSTGMHFNPFNMTHGDITSPVRHVGDLGNVLAVDGSIIATLNDSLLQLYGPNSVIGRAIVLHALPDDLGLGNASTSLTTGNSGARIGCAVIGYAN